MTETRPERKLKEVPIGADHKPINDLFNHICPDCGCEINKPNYVREAALSDGYYNDNVFTIHIECPVCGFRTNEHATVKACYEEWNQCEL